ncbi:unnamed protein product [Ectocarpus sp. CCAP 1310/34]|nr:unnamed protein product [Ectocarpus sp. CCAP 1310/34]
MSGRDKKEVQVVPTATASSNADTAQDEVPRRAPRDVLGETTAVRDSIKPSRGATLPVEGNRAAKRLRHAPLADAALPTEAAETNAGRARSPSGKEAAEGEGVAAGGVAAAAAAAAAGNRTQKRIDYLVWDDYFMSVAFLSAMRSKDPSTQVGAWLRCVTSIVNQDKRIVGIGYNGFPMGCSDDDLPWARRADDELDTKYPVRPVGMFLLVRCLNTPALF